MATRKSAEPTRRRYSSRLRQQQAGQTREQVLAAAAELFGQSGWAGTTVAAIAQQAGVAVETVYSGFGSKKQLLRAVVDVAIVGDTEPVPLFDRDAFKNLAVGTRDARVDAGIAMLTDIQTRIAGLWRTVAEAAASDDEIAAWRRSWDDGRRTDIRRSVELILGHEIDEVTVDLLWCVFSHEAYALLVFDRGLDRTHYVERMRAAVTALTSVQTPRRRASSS
jgi:AcrR family transcriptional regulator